jgi:cytochrome c5
MKFDTALRQKTGAFALIPVLSVLMLLGAGCSKQESAAPEEAAPAQEESSMPATPEPMAQAAETEAEAPAASGESASPAMDATPAGTQTAAADGQTTYETYCKACHATGVAGAPKLGDKEAWAPRIAKGNDALLNSAKNGLNAMPPMGTCMTCSDEDLKAAIAYMVEQSS